MYSPLQLEHLLHQLSSLLKQVIQQSLRKRPQHESRADGPHAGGNSPSCTSCWCDVPTWRHWRAEQETPTVESQQPVWDLARKQPVSHAGPAVRPLLRLVPAADTPGTTEVVKSSAAVTAAAAANGRALDAQHPGRWGPYAACGAQGAVNRCSNCQTAFYCDTACQKKDWKAFHCDHCP
mmetsp:Transcript_24258/g.43792  ORF Transcript_24258/g.43792 Transcript_24258/m.43792 type:complete len:179 (-) Transcript_24258:1041-1577(-)